MQSGVADLAAWSETKVTWLGFALDAKKEVSTIFMLLLDTTAESVKMDMVMPETPWMMIGWDDDPFSMRSRSKS